MMNMIIKRDHILFFERSNMGVVAIVIVFRLLN